MLRNIENQTGSIGAGSKRSAADLILDPAVTETVNAAVSPSTETVNSDNQSDTENYAAKRLRLSDDLHDKINPSKVVHVRNLPADTSENEVMAIALPFGQVTNMILMRNKRQAFVEMGDIAQAMELVRKYQNPTCPAVIRGQAIQVQYSATYTELKPGQRSHASGMKPTPVLHVNIDNLLIPVTLPVLHQLFSRYGIVEKIITFSKNNQFQALIQMQDVNSAQMCKQGLDGKSVFRNCCVLRIDFSKMLSVNVKYNNDKSRDFTNPNLPSGDETLPPLYQAAVASQSASQAALLAPKQQQQQPPPPTQQHRAPAPNLLPPAAHPNLVSSNSQGSIRLALPSSNSQVNVVSSASHQSLNTSPQQAIALQRMLGNMNPLMAAASGYPAAIRAQLNQAAVQPHQLVQSLTGNQQHAPHQLATANQITPTQLAANQQLALQQLASNHFNSSQLSGNQLAAAQIHAAMQQQLALAGNLQTSQHNALQLQQFPRMLQPTSQAHIQFMNSALQANHPGAAAAYYPNPYALNSQEAQANLMLSASRTSISPEQQQVHSTSPGLQHHTGSNTNGSNSNLILVPNINSKVRMNAAANRS